MRVSHFQDFLGKLIESYPSFFLKLGRLETQWVKDTISGIQIDRPIYVAGLARSGSTILLELLASHSEIGSHQYKDFPMVYTPIWWNWFLRHAGAREQVAIERAHKDRIKVTANSPEAMEEVIWMAFFANSHESRVNNVLGDKESNPDFETFYQNHIRKILYVRGGTRYLAKGNYNISRLGYICRLFPDARIVIPVRDPVNHIASIMRQHQLFCDAEASDRKVLNYMRRAGHFEFGLDTRPINFDCLDSVERIETLWSDGEDIRGWAVYWASAYSFLADLCKRDEAFASHLLFVDYNDFCKQPAALLQRIYTHCEIEVDDAVIQQQATRISFPRYYTPDFSDTDLKIIHEETRDTVEALQRLTAE